MADAESADSMSMMAFLLSVFDVLLLGN